MFNTFQFPIYFAQKSSSKPPSSSDLKALVDSHASETVTVQRYAPASLFNLAAMLIGFEMITLDDLIPYLQPKFSSLVEKFREVEQEASTSIRSRGLTSSMPSDTKISGGHVASTKTKAMESKEASSNPGSEQTKKLVQRVAYATDSVIYAGGEQIIGILAALLKLHHWETAKPLLDRLKAAGVAATSWIEVADALAGMVSWVIDPVFADISHRKRGIAKPLTGLLPVPELKHQPVRLTNVSQMFDTSSSQVLLFLGTLGHSLSCKPVLLCKICRMLVPFLSANFPELSTLSVTVSEVANSALSSEKQAILRGSFTLISESILPAFSKISKRLLLYILFKEDIIVLPRHKSQHAIRQFQQTCGFLYHYFHFKSDTKCMTFGKELALRRKHSDLRITVSSWFVN